MGEFLDTKGLACPLPVLKTRRALRNMPSGKILTVEATDPASVIDFTHFCNTTDHEMAGQKPTDFSLDREMAGQKPVELSLCHSLNIAISSVTLKTRFVLPSFRSTCAQI